MSKPALAIFPTSVTLPIRHDNPTIAIGNDISISSNMINIAIKRLTDRKRKMIHHDSLCTQLVDDQLFSPDKHHNVGNDRDREHRKDKQ